MGISAWLQDLLGQRCRAAKHTYTTLIEPVSLFTYIVQGKINCCTCCTTLYLEKMEL